MDSMLEYQKLDGKLLKLNRDATCANEKETMNKMISYVKDAQNKTLQLESMSEKLIKEYHALKSDYDKNFAIIQGLIKVDTTNLNGDEVQENLRRVNALSSELFMIERNINLIITKINERLKEFEVTKNNALKARARHRSAKEVYDKKVSDMEPEIKKVTAELKKLESKISKDMLTKYKTIKNDGIFPVYVPLNDKSCGGCRMELPSRVVNKMLEEKMVVCEHCRRIIFKL